MLSLRIDLKYYIILIVILALLLGVTVGLLFSDSECDYRQLAFLEGEKYLYSFDTVGSVGQNDYLNCTGKMSISADGVLGVGILADVLMLLPGSEYTDLAPFFAELDSDECAISANLAGKQGISLGDKLYSKHRVSEKTVSYTVSAILPECYGVVEGGSSSTGRGVILVGYDGLFKENILCENIAFTDISPSAVISDTGAALSGITTKSELTDELKFSLAVCQSVLSVIVILLSVVAVVWHHRMQRGYYTRLALYGMSRGELIGRYFADHALPAVIANFLAAIVSSAILSIHHGVLAFYTPLICAAVGVVASLICSLILLKEIKRL